MDKKDIFASENVQLEYQGEYRSDSDRYKLVVTPFSTTGRGYTQGKVYRAASDELIAIIQRNYSAFPHLFIEAHPTGSDYLVCGEDYQGQTVINLTTGERRDELPEAAITGHGFCWADYRYDPGTQILVVAGCYWACPYEFRFYDFSAPQDGWPEIEAETFVVDDEHWPTLDLDGTVTTYEAAQAGDDDKYAAVTKLKRDGLTLKLVETWVSAPEQARRAASEAAAEAWENWVNAFRTTNPYYLAHKAQLLDWPYAHEDHASYGVIHDHWCPGVEASSQRTFNRRIVDNHDGWYATLAWGIDTGPIKLELSGVRDETKVFPELTVASIAAAYAYARDAIETSVK